jgi:glycosyltransferase involved in cell wall biosynthesis
MRIAAIIPTLNEGETIGELVRETQKQPVDQIIVVDNASTDATAERAREAGATVITEMHRGYGAACAAGVAAARDADVLVFLDGDFSFLPSEMPALVTPLREGGADLVLGSRTRGIIVPGAMPPQQKLGNALGAWMLRALYRTPLTDLGPYRAITRELMDSLQMRERTFGWPVEMIVKAIKQGARVIEIPVSYHCRRAGDSKVSGTARGTILAGYHIIRLIVRYAPA